jgi:autotransporter-associated beta strand protein
MTHRIALAGLVLLATGLGASKATAQVTYNVTYADGAGAGFNDNTVDAGETLSRSQLRKNTITAVINYMQTVFDGRGTVDLHWNVSDTAPGGFLASFGPNGFAGINGSFQNGQAYQRLRSGNKAFNGVDADGTFDFTYGWNYIGANNNNGSKYDMFTVALHEFSHGMGFLNGTNQNGQGLMLNPAGNPDVYTGYDKFLQRGNGVGGFQFNTDVTNAGYGSFIGNASTFTNGNNTTTGLFFGGQYAREVFNNPVPLYAPASYAPGSSIGHDNTTPAGVMNFNIGQGVERRAYLDYEIGMLLDLGYNVYNWNGNTNASWSGGNVTSLAASPWRTDMGIVFGGAAGGNAIYNTFNNPDQAPILAPYGQVTSNIVLNFSGTSAYTSTNDLNTMRMSRINLNSTAGSASTITGGTLLFGQNSDGTLSVLRPKIVQKNSGAFIFGSTINIADPVRGLTVDGPGSGTLTFNGNLTGAGGLTKAGTFTMIMNGAANSYAGTTTVNEGVLRVNGAKTGTGAVVINNAGRLQGSGSIAGATTVNTGGFLAPGASAGNLTLSGGLTMNAGVYDWELVALSTSNPGTNFDVITLAGGSSVFGGTSAVQLNFDSLGAGLDPNGSNVFWQSARQWQIVSLFSGSFTGVFGSITNPNWSSGVFSLFGNGTGIFLGFSPVPEPSTFVLLGVVGGGWMLLRRRRRVDA